MGSGQGKVGNKQEELPNRPLSDKEKTEWRSRYQLTPDVYEEVRRAFNQQKGPDDMIGRESFLKVVTSNGVTPEFAVDLFDSFDADGNGRISMREYLVMTGVSFGGSLDQKLEASFSVFDRDHSGYLTRDELLHMLHVTTLSVLRQQARLRNRPPPTALSDSDQVKLKALLEDIMRLVDANNDQKVSLDEFKSGFRDHPEVCAFFSQF